MDQPTIPDQAAESSEPDLLGVVGIGASAGGLEPLQDFLTALGPDGRGLAIVVIQHLDPAGPNLLPELLQRATPLHLREVREEAPVRPGYVYVAPPQTLLTLAGGVLRPDSPGPGEERRAPIDTFLHSLAQDQGERAVGVILSGTGTDGTLGLKAVSDAGGMTIAQDPLSASYESMPRNAASLGMADHVLPPGLMPAVILNYLRHVYTLGLGHEQELRRQRIVEVLPEICDILCRYTEHDFRHYKTNTLVRRVQRRMQVLQMPSVEDYAARLHAERPEAEALFKELLIGVTAFFRDPDAFETLGREVLAKLVAGRARSDTVRIWVAGGATGEEAYSLAILLREILAPLPAPPAIQIFATDIDERALRVAREGSYPQGIADQLAPERLQRFFVKKDSRYQVVKELREICLFSLHNLISDPPFSRLDLISCRNLLIYLGAHLQKKLIPLFHYALRPNGYLFLGPAENLSMHEELFRPISVRHRILQRKRSAVSTIRSPLAPHWREGYRAGVPLLEVGTPLEPDIPQLAQRIVLDEFTPRYAVVNSDGQIVCVSGGTGRYLEPAPGAFHNNILRMARAGLRAGLHAALHGAIETRRTCAQDDLAVTLDQGVQRVRVHVQPMPKLGEDKGLYLVVFQDTGPLAPREENRGAESTEQAAAVIEHLERELSTTREDLDKTIQNLEAFNEELKSSNEELLSMNEELQSANEELETSKEEIEAANEALARAHSDLENLFTSTRIATLFLDAHQNIRSFTPAATEIYNLLPGDVGRPIGHITHRVRRMPPLPELRDAAAEEEIESLEGRVYLRRVLPYRSHDGRLDGMVLTFIDVTALRESERAARASEARMRLALDAGHMSTWHWDARTGVVSVDDTQFALLGIERGRFEPTPERLLALVHEEDLPQVREAVGRSLQSGNECELSFRIRRPDGELRWLTARGRVLLDDQGQPVQMLGVNYDSTTHKQAEEELARAVRFSDMFVGILSHDLRNPLSAIRVTAEMLARQPGTDRTARQVARLLNSSQRMERMVEQLLDFTRIRLGKGIPVHPGPLDLSEVCQGVIVELEGRAATGEIVLSARGDTKGAWDLDRIAQLVSNLLGNALQHRVPGGAVRVQIDGSAPEQVVLEVWNPGAVAAHLLPGLFEPLSGGADHSDSSKGLGLGLYISQQIARAHGGRIEVRSSPAEGTTFAVLLPRTCRSAEEHGYVFR